MTYIRELENYGYYSGNYLVDAISIKVSRTGKEYMQGVLKDKTGTIRFVRWNLDNFAVDIPNMSIVYVEFDVSSYNDEIEATVQKMYAVSPTDVKNLDDLLETPPESIESMKREIAETVKNMDDHDYALVVTEIMKNETLEKFKTIPGGKFYHHAMPGGLLMHTLGVLRMAKAIAAAYPAGIVNKDLLYAGAILHDIGKVYEFEINNIGLVSNYSNEGALEGHIYMGAKMVGDACDRLIIPSEKSMLLQHLILSHHGDSEMGSPVLPQTVEAFILHEADLIDATLYKYKVEYGVCEQGTVSKSQTLKQNIYVPKQIPSR